MPEGDEKIELELNWKDMPLSVKIGIPVSFVLAALGLLLQYLFK